MDKINQALGILEENDMKIQYMASIAEMFWEWLSAAHEEGEADTGMNVAFFLSEETARFARINETLIGILNAYRKEAGREIA